GGDAGAGQQGDDGVDGRVGAGQRDAVVAVLGRGQAGQRGEVGLVQRGGRGEADDGGAGRAADEPGRGVQGGHPSPVDHRDPVAEPLGLLHEVGDQQDGDAAGADVLDELPGVAPGPRVESGGQFVEDHHPGVADQGERDGQALLLTARQLAVAGLQLCREPEAFGQRPPVGGGGVEGRVELQGLPDRQLRLQRAPLELGAEDPGDLFVLGDGVESGDPDPPPVGHPQALHAFDGGGLAGAVRAEDPEDLPLLDGEGHPVDHGPAAVRLAQIGDFDDGHGGQSSGGPSRAHRPSRSTAIGRSAAGVARPGPPRPVRRAATRTSSASGPSRAGPKLGGQCQYRSVGSLLMATTLPTPDTRPEDGSGPDPEPRSTVRTLLRLWPYVRPVRARLFTAAFIAVLASCIGLVIPLVLKWMVDGPIADRDPGGVWLGALYLLLLGLAEALLFGFRRGLLASPLPGVAPALRADLCRQQQRLPVAFHDRWPSGQLLSRGPTALMLLRMFLAFPLTFLLVNSVTILVGVIIMLVQDWTLGLVVLVPAVPVMVTCLVFEKRYSAASRRAQDQVGDLTTVVEESVLGIRIVKGFGRHRSQARAFHELAGRLRGTELHKAR